VSPGRRTTGADVGAIDQPQVPVDLALLVQADLQGFEDFVEESLASPASAAALFGKQVFDQFPLFVREFVASHEASVWKQHDVKHEKRNT
jgi:hypothetical protein